MKQTYFVTHSTIVAGPITITKYGKKLTLEVLPFISGTNDQKTPEISIATFGKTPECDDISYDISFTNNSVTHQVSCFDFTIKVTQYETRNVDIKFSHYVEGIVKLIRVEPDNMRLSHNGVKYVVVDNGWKKADDISL